MELRRQLVCLHTIHSKRTQWAETTRARYALVEWQSDRLRSTYADLRTQERYALATDFFLSEIYAPVDFSRRDRDLEKITPILVRMLPTRAIDVLALAMELNVLTHELDDELLARLGSGTGVPNPITVRDYATAYRACHNEGERVRQIQIIRSLGNDLDELVRHRMLYTVVKTMRRPAELAGYADLHRFLEKGFVAFRKMKGAGHFLDTIHSRETQILERLRAGHPAPFDFPERGLSTTEPTPCR
jgi:hypothetical protein